MTYMLVSVQVAKKHRVKDIRKFWPMPWDSIDEKEEAKRLNSLTDEKRKEEVKKFLKKVKL